MSSTTLFEMPFSELQLKNAVSSALQQSLNNPTKFSIESNLEAAVRDTIQNNLGNIKIGDQCDNCSSFGIGTGFFVKLQIHIGYNMRLGIKASAGAGIQYNLGNIKGNQSLMFSFLRSSHGLGTSKFNDQSIDIVFSASIAFGEGKGDPMNSYTINYDLPEPFVNTFNRSISIGQALTWNSAINDKFNFKDIQRQGFYNIRIGDFSLSTNNDSRYYLGGNTDYGWTGGIILSFLLASGEIIEAGYQNFTGKYNEKGKQEKEIDSLDSLKYNKDNFLGLSKREWKGEIKEEKNNILYNTPYHSQDEYQQSFNKASTYFRLVGNNSQIRLDFECDGYLQNWLHLLLKNLKFPYNNGRPVYYVL